MKVPVAKLLKCCNHIVIRRCMAWIEVDEVARKAIWIDGYLPPRNKLIDVCELYKDVDYRGYLSHCPKPSHSNDEIFKRTAIAIRNYWEKTTGDGRDWEHDCDMFIYKFTPDQDNKLMKQGLIIQPGFRMGENLKRELKKESGKENYRQIIVSFSPYACDTGEKCTMNFINRLNFKIREPKTYRNYEEFKRDCELLLDRYLLQPYVAPCTVVADRMKKIDFQEQESDVY